MCAGPAHALVFENSVVNGGALTQSQLDQINEFYICASIEFQTRSRAPFICPLEQQIAVGENQVGRKFSSNAHDFLRGSNYFIRFLGHS